MASLVITEQGNLIPQQPGEQSSQEMFAPASWRRKDWIHKPSFTAPICLRIYSPEASVL